MLEAQTLEELKAENAAAENEGEEEPQSSEPEGEVKPEEGEGESIQDAEPGDEAGKPDSEAWKLSDDEGSQGDRTVPVAAHAALRAKLKGKISEQNEENAALRAKVDELERRLNAAPVSTPKVGKPPKPEDFDTDAEYEEANRQYLLSEVNEQAAKERQKTQQLLAQQEQEAAVSQRVDAHYARAIELAETNNIDADQYKSADLAFRQVVGELNPSAGDALADQLIARMGEGSEKLVYYIGRSKEAQNKIRQSLRDDPTGLSATMLMGRMMGEKVSNSGRRTSRAPEPAPSATGNATVSPDAAALKKQYQKATKANDQQGAMAARINARKKGLDVSSW